jgi:hypothetical protein
MIDLLIQIAYSWLLLAVKFCSAILLAELLCDFAVKVIIDAHLYE